jgi:hypothetical protein
MFYITAFYVFALMHMYSRLEYLQVWFLVRLMDNIEQSVSSWTGFNIQIRNNVSITQDKVGYLPTINAPATDLTTVNEILQQCLKIRKLLELESITCVFDQALYAKAAEIAWKGDYFKSIVLRMGVFHTLCRMISIIGKRFKDGGLRDLAVESGVIAEGSVDGVLEGRKYNRAIRFLKLLYEALLRLSWTGFKAWIEETYPEDVLKLHDTMACIEELHCDIRQEKMEEIMIHPSCVYIFELYGKYLSVLRNSRGDMSAFWMSCIDMFEIVLGLIRASREGN